MRFREMKKNMVDLDWEKMGYRFIHIVSTRKWDTPNSKRDNRAEKRVASG